MAITLDDVKAGLAELGLKKGDVVLVHSDLRSLGKARELVKLPNCGADLIIDAFIETVGGEGLVIFPTFTKAFEDKKFGPSGQIYDPAETPSRVGSVTDIAWRRPNAKRSLQPTHPVCAIGDRAEEFVKAPEDQSTFDRRGPWGRMYDWDGVICWFGTDNRTSTTVHVLEDWMRLPYMAECYAMIKGSNGEPVRQLVTQSPAGPRDFYKENSHSAQLLDASGIIKRKQIGRGTASLMTVKDTHRVLREGIINDPCLLLPDENPTREWVTKYRKLTIEHVRREFGGGDSA